MDKNTRKNIFAYIYEKADVNKYMAMDSAESGKFQSDLENDSELQAIAGEKIDRLYIKDTVLNKYSKSRRYIDKKDVLSVLSGITDESIVGTKNEIENGIFSINYENIKLVCTSTTLQEWHTALKRFGRFDSKKDNRLTFLTCGGVEKSTEEIINAKETLASYGVKSIVVKPNESAISIHDLFSTTDTAPTASKSWTLPKPFLLLAGISGTGKSRFVKRQAEMHTKGRVKNYLLVPVRPDWHEPSDILGYVSRLSGKPEYVPSETLKFIIDAWSDHAADFNGSRIGELNQNARPFWLCLDEMNLAPVEQYFSDYLSVLESRSIENGIYSCEPLIPAMQLELLEESFRVSLGLEDNQELWDYFLQNGISIPPNLIVAGTVNMDETTHGFSRKVIDRAFTLDFGEFFPNEFQHFFHGQPNSVCFRCATITNITEPDLQGTVDTDGRKSIAFLNQINDTLRSTPFELAYRALNELLLNIACYQPSNQIELQSVWDDFLMTKVLPRIEGDDDKLNGNSNQDNDSLLHKLSATIESNFTDIWNTGRPDFFRTDNNGEYLAIEHSRSKIKLDWMIRRLDERAYTSFWP